MVILVDDLPDGGRVGHLGTLHAEIEVFVALAAEEAVGLRVDDRARHAGQQRVAVRLLVKVAEDLHLERAAQIVKPHIRLGAREDLLLALGQRRAEHQPLAGDDLLEHDRIASVHLVALVVHAQPGPHAEAARLARELVEHHLVADARERGLAARREMLARDVVKQLNHHPKAQVAPSVARHFRLVALRLTQHVAVEVPRLGAHLTLLHREALPLDDRLERCEVGPRSIRLHDEQRLRRELTRGSEAVAGVGVGGVGVLRAADAGDSDEAVVLEEDDVADLDVVVRHGHVVQGSHGRHGDRVQQKVVLLSDRR